MYLNLDLLYNVNDFLFPLFYYESLSTKKVYSPITKKSIIYMNTEVIYYDCTTFNFPNYNYYFTQKISFRNHYINGYNCVPFEVNKKDLEYLKTIN